MMYYLDSLNLGTGYIESIVADSEGFGAYHENNIRERCLCLYKTYPGGSLDQAEAIRLDANAARRLIEVAQDYLHKHAGDREPC